MKDLEKLITICKADLTSVGISWGRVEKWTVNARAKTRWGLCRPTASGGFELQISRQLLEDTVSDQAVKDTIVHELLHTVPGCLKHTGKWKLLADTVNAGLPGYRIRRATRPGEKGLKEPEPKYLLQCTQCGRQVGRNRKSSVIQAPGCYRCPCGGAFIRIR